MADRDLRHVMRGLIGKPATIAATFEVSELVDLRASINEALLLKGPGARDPAVDPRPGDVIGVAWGPGYDAREVVELELDEQGRTIVRWFMMSSADREPHLHHTLLNTWALRYESGKVYRREGEPALCRKQYLAEVKRASCLEMNERRRRARMFSPLRGGVCRGCRENRKNALPVSQLLIDPDVWVANTTNLVEGLVGASVEGDSQATAGSVEGGESFSGPGNGPSR